MRLDKYIADMGMGTRSEIKKEIKAGKVSVNGMIIKDPSAQVKAGDDVSFGGKPIIYEEFVYYMMNKPAGVISASDDRNEETVVDLIRGNKRKDLFPAGRLDRDTEGLLLITNDGQFAHRMLSPKHHIDKKYYVEVEGVLTEDFVSSFAEGLTLPDGLECLPADLELINDSEAYVTIREGKFHQIKRMFQALGCEVVYLKRLSMGTLELDPELEPGDYRRLTAGEVDRLKKL